jgi:acyl-CoA reductase-like NAD-dependent aldehyde dehydrogenase
MFEPTVLINVNSTMKVCAEEIFGPVVTLEPYSTIHDAVDMVNIGKYGLQTGIFSNDLSSVHYAYEHLNVGGLIVNDYPTFRVDNMPYGGVKDSGFGREGVAYAIKEMTEPKLLVL